MKKPLVLPREPELLSYKLEYTPDLRCEKQTDLVPVCHRCKSCILSWRVFSTREWFLRASHGSQRQFLVGIIKRFKNQDLLVYAWNLLRSVTNSKEFTYSRSCVTSSFAPSLALDRALKPQQVAQSMASLWKWFLHASFWTKANYILLLLQMCDSQLVLMAVSLIRILLSRKKTKKVKAVEGKAEDEELTVMDQQKPDSDDLTDFTALSTGDPSVFESTFPSDRNTPFGPLQVQTVWSTDLDEGSEGSFEIEDAITYCSGALNVTTESPTPMKTPVNINRYKDFIQCLPIHLSKRILGMLDNKSLGRCVYVSSYWAFLVRQIRRDIASHRMLHHQIVYFQASCPKRAMASYARIVKVVIPQITEDGEIILLNGRSKLQVKDTEHLQKAYHGQMTSTIRLEERNIFCSGYNVRILVDQLDPNRVIHYNGGKLMAIGSADRKIHFLNVNMTKEVPPLIRGHAGSIRAIYLSEPNGFVLSGSFDLSIRMWSIITGTCAKIFNGHSGSITCLDVHKNKFVSGAKDCTAKIWDIETGKCLKTFKHKGIVWAAKMNDTHIVSACDKGEVKVWHAETFILIKNLEGHLGPVKCLSFDEWHLVTGSNDGYILGWSMVGNHKRCLMAFRHPMEVLYLGFLYLRVISGCADGKIRIFNFLTGTCLRIMRANSRGDPVTSFCIVENRLLINAKGSVVLFQFEDVNWDYTTTSERVTQRKDHSKFDDTPLKIKPNPYSHSERLKRAKKKNWKFYQTEETRHETMLSYYISRQFTRGSKPTSVLRNEMVKEQPPGTSPDICKNVVSMDSKPCDRKKLSSLARRKGQKSDESPAPVSTMHGQISEAFVNYIKKKHPLGPIATDQMLLTVSTIQHAYRADVVSINMAYNMKIKDAWGPDHPQKDQHKKSLPPQILKQQKMDLSSQLKHLKSASGTIGTKRISTPYETKTLQLNLKNSLLGDSVKSFIPSPTLTRSKSCSSITGEKKAYTSQVKISPPGGRQVIGHFTSSTESMKVPRMKIAQPDSQLILRRPKPFFAHTPNPYRLNTGFRLLTTQQMKEYAEVKVSEYQAKKTEVIANRQKVCKNAWLRKIKGLPIDDFTKEGKISAPELGQNVFI
ncbi:F-box and WD repeat domain containing protein 10B [Tiliqua scincoides]|uniref:F-box and WD repeat domain containing protein 10B n=1 Tax=Tiliqua scincoides TaxID=71010 RepID=UPI00346271FA